MTLGSMLTSTVFPNDLSIDIDKRRIFFKGTKLKAGCGCASELIILPKLYISLVNLAGMLLSDPDMLQHCHNSRDATCAVFVEL